jgi:tetratricopeptide (TPR) repeat protein
MSVAGFGLRRADPWGWWDQKDAEGSVPYHWEQAQLAVANRDLSLARSQLDRCLDICPLNPRVQFLMARTCRRDGDDSAWKLHLMMAEALGWPRQQIILEQRLQRAESGNSWSVEADLLDELNRLPPEEVLILEALVKGYLNNVRYPDAVEFTTIWIQRYPGDWLAYLYRGRAFQGMSVYSRAIADFQETLKLRPGSILAELWLADTLLADRQYREALDHYQDYMQTVPDDRDVLFAMANCQFSLGEPEARATLDNLLAKYPNHATGLFLAAKMDMVEGASSKALKRLQQAMALTPRDPEILHLLSLALRQLNRKAEADQFDQQFHKLLDQAEQMEQVRRKIQSQPEDASLRYQAGKLSLEIGQEKEALHWFQSVLWIEPDDRPTHLALADYWKNHGQDRRAAYHLRRAEGKRR